ncbi:CarD family transcriptional regulator [Lichenibacterium ramalinae]|uniref:CarD family transcriptional regulator n=1 Tax=Lichenibacterium ramalinae TaxID=2316527 RepID=UPI001FE1C6C7|nr:CarD family transcriptional regulator [Lichenibacterium ramalinae]
MSRHARRHQACNSERIIVTQKSASSPAEADVAPASAEKVTPRARSSFGAPGSRPGFPSKSIRPAPAGQQVKADSGKSVAKVPGSRQGFKAGEFIVYPAHGVGEIVAIEEEEVAGFKLELFVISFAKDKMKLKVPLPKVAAVGMRKLSDPEAVQKGLDTLAGRARVKRTMWSRRAQEYEAKINSGDLIAVAEVVRDLYRSDAQPEQSYSERQLYEAALDRLAREIAAVQKLTDSEVAKLIETQLQKSPRRSKAEAEADAEADAEEGDVEEAA